MFNPIKRIVVHRKNSGFFFLPVLFLCCFLPSFLQKQRIRLHFVISRMMIIRRRAMDAFESRLQKGFLMQMLTYSLLIIILLMGSSAKADETKAFHWVDDADYPPLIYRGADGKPAGIFYQIMTEAFHRLGIPLKVETYPWARAQKIVAEGKADGVITVLNDQRKRFFIGSDPILRASEHIFVNRNNPRIKEIMAIRSLKAIRPFRVVETIGSGWTKEKLKGVRITWVPTMESAFKMLIKDRADIFLANGFVGAAFLQKKIKNGVSNSEGYKSIITNPYPLRTIAFRLFIRKDSPFIKILDDFNKTIHQMRADGTIRHILEGTHLPQLNGVNNQR